MPGRKRVKTNNKAVKDIETSPISLIGREREFDILFQRLETALVNHTPTSLYICGRPGTGKTLTVGAVIKDLEHRKQTKKCIKTVLMVNGMGFSSPTDLFSELALRLKIASAGKTLKTLESQVKAAISSPSPAAPMILILLDEVDKLVSGTRVGLIETLFSLPFLPESKVILVTIANAVDLTERLLSKATHREIQPEVILFETYTEVQISDIISSRYSDVSIEEAALTFCAKKVAQTSGDIRIALDLCDNARTGDSITFQEITRKANQFFVSPTAKVIRGLPFQQQVVLSTLTTSRCNSQLSVGAAYAQYLAKSRVKRWETMSSGDYFDALSTLGIYGLVQLTQTKGGSEMREAQVEILVSREELLHALDGHVQRDALLTEDPQADS